MEFIACEDNLVPLIGARASRQMYIISVNLDHFDLVHIVNDGEYVRCDGW